MKIIKSRLFKILIALFIFGFCLGIISSFISKDNSSIINYFNTLENEKINYFNSFITSFSYNLKYSFIIWIVGIIFCLSFITPIIIIFRGISVGFTVFSIIIELKLKGFIIALIMLFPMILINEIVFILLGYYSIRFSIKCFNSFKNNSLINIKSFSKNYIYIFLILSLVLLVSSLLETFITSNIVKFML